MSDEAYFAVVYKFDYGRSAIFEGSEEEVYRWLDRGDDISIWHIWDRAGRSYETSREFLDRLKEKYAPKPQLTEEDVIRIVDKRVGEILETVAKEAESRTCGLAAYGVDEMMKPAFSAISKLLEEITSRLSGEDN